MLGSIRRKVFGKRTLEIDVHGGGANTKYENILIISNRKDSFRNLALNWIKDEKLQRSARTKNTISKFHFNCWLKE